MDNGYIKLHRQIQESEIWNKPSDWFKIWCYILMQVNFKENGLPIGSKHLKYEWIQSSCRVKKNTIQGFIKFAKHAGMLTTQKTTRGFIIEVSKYSQYQVFDYEDKTTQKPRQKLHRNHTETTLYNKKERIKEYNISEDILEQSSAEEEIPEEKKEYGDPKINTWLKFLFKTIGISEFKESQTLQRRFTKHIMGLAEKIGNEEFKRRMKEILQDEFKAKNCNKIEYLYGELKAFIHSPIVPPKKTQKKSGVVIVDNNF